MEKVYHPFIAGPFNKLVGEIMQETGTRINIPPPSVNRTEIVFTGEKEQLAQAVACVKKIYEEKVKFFVVSEQFDIAQTSPELSFPSDLWGALPCLVSPSPPQM